MTFQINWSHIDVSNETSFGEDGVYTTKTTHLKILSLQKAAARERYEISIQEIEHDERQAQKKADELSTRDKEMELHKVRIWSSLPERLCGIEL